MPVTPSSLFGVIEPIQRTRTSLNRIDISKAPITAVTPSKELYEQALQVETFAFDNSRSRSTSTETFVIRQSRKMVTTVDFQKVKSSSTGASIQLFGIFGAEARFTNEIRRSRSLGQESELTVEQTTSINIPANTRVKVEIHWKLVWERGVCKVSAIGQMLDVPYSVTKRLRFDKKVIDF